MSNILENTRDNFKVAVTISAVAKISLFVTNITFVVAKITFKVAVMIASVAKITFDRSG